MSHQRDLLLLCLDCATALSVDTFVQPSSARSGLRDLKHVIMHGMTAAQYATCWHIQGVPVTLAIQCRFLSQATISPILPSKTTSAQQ